MQKMLIIFVFLLLTACSTSNHYVALYKDVINKEAILAIFPADDPDVAMDNCESTVDLYEADDQKNMTVSPVTGRAPIYYCQEITGVFSY